MALFSFGDIKFKEEQRSAARSLYDATNQKPYNLYRYPVDLGDHGKGHYMIIYINEQLKTQYPGNPTGDLPSIYRYAYANDSDASAAAASWTPSKDSSQQFSTKYVRTIRRISDAVALYMPDTLLFGQSQNYTGMQIGGGMPAAAVAGGMSMVDSYKPKKSTSTTCPRLAKKFVGQTMEKAAELIAKSMVYPRCNTLSLTHGKPASALDFPRFSLSWHSNGFTLGLSFPTKITTSPNRSGALPSLYGAP